MKFKFYKSDGSSDGEKDIKDFPVLDDGKGVDALRQAIIAVHANQRQGTHLLKFVQKLLVQGKRFIDKKG